MKKVLLFIFILINSCAFEIKSITFKGLIHLSPQMAKEIVGLEEHTTYDPFKANEAIHKLFKQGYFEDIWIENNNSHIIFHIKEKPSIALIEYEGVSEEDGKNLKTIVGINKGMVYDKNAIKSAKKNIVDYFQAKGYFDTVVEEEAKRLGDTSGLEITFNINRGEELIINNISLNGAEVLDYSDVEPYLINKEKEVLGWFWGFNDGTLVLPALPTDGERIKDRYLHYGYLDAKVSSAFLKLNYDTYEADINYKIEEGEKYTVKDVDISMGLDLLDIKELKEDLKLEKGETFNVKKLRYDLNLIETKVADLGYAYVRVYPQTNQDKKEKTVSVTYTVYPGEKVRIGKVVIGGNQRTADHVIRRDVYLGPGELYSKTSLKDTKDALKRTGYFDDVTISQKRIDSQTMDLYVNVKESSTGSIKGGIGYGSTQGLIFDAGIADENIFGSGLHGSLNANKSDDEIYGSLNLTNPRVYDSIYSLGGSIYARNNNWNSYDEKMYGGSITVGRKFGRYIHGSIGYILEKTTISDLSDDLKRIGYLDGTHTKSAFVPRLRFNNTDDYYLPRRGFILGASLEYAGAGGDEKFIKAIGTFKTFYGLEDWLDYDLILRYKARIRGVKDKGYLPINERLYLGGISSIRGYDSRSIGPKNEQGERYGGEVSFNNSIEASIPLINRIKMRAALFYDYGMIGLEKLNEFERSSAGVTIEWLSPLGAINLIFARAIDPEDDDDTSRFEFSIGRQF